MCGRVYEVWFVRRAIVGKRLDNTAIIYWDVAEFKQVAALPRPH